MAWVPNGALYMTAHLHTQAMSGEVCSLHFINEILEAQISRLAEVHTARKWLRQDLNPELSHHSSPFSKTSILEGVQQSLGGLCHLPPCIYPLFPSEKLSVPCVHVGGEDHLPNAGSPKTV